METVSNDQLNLDQIHPSWSLTLIETTTYFEAYRPILNALQMIPSDARFPLGSTLLKLHQELRPPKYLTSTTTYDFTPLLVNRNIDVKTNPIEQRYKLVKLLDKNEWPTSEQLDLNPRQYEALMLALTNKVALVQGRECS